MAELVKVSRCSVLRQLHRHFRIDQSLDSTAAATAAADTKAVSQRRASTGSVSINTLSLSSSSSSSNAKASLTSSGEFRLQLAELMSNINTTAPHYIRCLKPNTRNVGGVLDAMLVMTQLRYGGVLEAVKVTRAGFPR